MNPWEIVSWIAAACVAVLLITVTCATVAGLIKGQRKRTTRIL